MTHTLCFLIGLTLGALVAFVATLRFCRKFNYRLGFEDAEELYEKHLVRALDYNANLKREVARVEHEAMELTRALSDCRKQHKRDVALLQDALQCHAQVRGLNDRAATSGM